MGAQLVCETCLSFADKIHKLMFYPNVSAGHFQKLFQAQYAPTGNFKYLARESLV